MAAALAGGCHTNIQGGHYIGDGGTDGPNFALPDLLGADFSTGENACGDTDPSCTGFGFSPPQSQFPLGDDPMPDPNETDQGVARDPATGALILGASKANFDFIYTANTEDWGIGTVSKLNSKSVKEVARYFSVTCWSNPGGGRGTCDGTNGCCARDDYDGFYARAQGTTAKRQKVQLSSNYPSRTAVDFNGDVWVANRAFGGQSSVSKIANEIASCVERNGEPGIQTSSDVDGNGLIDADCNRNHVPDDVADVKAAPCVNGKPQEFYGFDDECILFTTNTNTWDKTGRPLALGRGATDFAPADAWAGSWGDGRFFRIDGTTGLTKAMAQIPTINPQAGFQSHPYGAAIDGNGILWAPVAGGNEGAPHCYFDTASPQSTGCVRMPSGYSFGYGIGMDRDQNVWFGGYPGPHAFRYTPDRSNGFANLGKGYWTIFTNVGVNTGASGCQGRGIAADSRTPAQYWVWMACHTAPYVVRLDGNTPKPAGADKTVDASSVPAIRVGGGAIAGAGIDIQQNVWAVGSTGAVNTRILVDGAGNATPPSLAGSPGSGCPVGNGDFCATRYTAGGTEPDFNAYTYSDFTGFGLRNFTNPSGEWSYVLKGCEAGDTKWIKVEWDADVPPNTTFSVRARSGQTAKPDMSWGNWTSTFGSSPGSFENVLTPNNPAQYLQIRFNLATVDKASTPKLKSFHVYYECLNIPG